MNLEEVMEKVNEKNCPECGAAAIEGSNGLKPSCTCMEEGSLAEDELEVNEWWCCADNALMVHWQSVGPKLVEALASLAAAAREEIVHPDNDTGYLETETIRALDLLTAVEEVQGI